MNGCQRPRGFSLYAVDDAPDELNTSFSSQAHINRAYENNDLEVIPEVEPLPESGERRSHLYEDPTDFIQQMPHTRTQPIGPRKKASEIYEPTGPLEIRASKLLSKTEHEPSVGSIDTEIQAKDSCLSRLILCLILFLSITALVLVVMIIFGKLGPKDCGQCTTGSTSAAAQGSTRGGETKSEISLTPLVKDLRKVNKTTRTLLAQVKQQLILINALQAELREVRQEIEMTKLEANRTKNDTENEQLRTRKEMSRLWNDSSALWSKANTTQTELDSEKDKTTQLFTKTMELNSSLSKTATDVSALQTALETTKGQVNSKFARVWNNLNSTTSCCAAVTTKVNTTIQGYLAADESLSNFVVQVNETLTQKVDQVTKMSGPIGPRGYNGSNGAQGPQGLQGLAGFNGTQGTQGPRGYNGSQGPEGQAGTQGPQGPQGPQGSKGAGDMSACGYFTSTGTPITPSSAAQAMVHVDETADKRITGVHCDSDRAALVRLITTVTNGLRRFVCRCYGDSSYTSVSISSMACTIHYWQCPRTSP